MNHENENVNFEDLREKNGTFYPTKEYFEHNLGEVL
jgi:hypothetical protein